MAVGDKDLVDIATGKLNGQKAFMAGKIKVKGNMMVRYCSNSLQFVTLE